MIAEHALHVVLRDERLDRARQREAEDQRPERLPEHEERLTPNRDVAERRNATTCVMGIATLTTGRTCDGRRRFGDLLVRLGSALDDRVGNAGVEVAVEQLERDGLQRFRGGGDLGEHVDAVHVFVNHALQATDLALDAAQPTLHVVLDVGVPGLTATRRHETLHG